MYGVQTEKLRFHQEQEERHRPAGVEEILPVVSSSSTA
jgi:hypothetical protein